MTLTGALETAAQKAEAIARTRSWRVFVESSMSFRVTNDTAVKHGSVTSRHR